MNTTTAAVLKLLKSSDSYISGEQICQQLNISRTAVWKHIKTLKKLGYVIEAAPKRGYRITEETADPIPEQLEGLLNTEHFATKICYHKEICSTNRLLMEQAKNGAESGLTIIADRQTAGHGRMQRNWFSPSACNIYFSNLLRPEIEPYRAPQIALLCAAAMYDALKELFSKIPFGIKWPNDLFIDDKKCAGILCEMQTDMTTVQHVVIGIGLNVNVTSFPQELEDIATSISIHTGHEENRSQILAAIINRLDSYYKIWLKEGLQPFLATLNNASVLKGKQISVDLATKEVTGMAKEIAEDGTLVITSDNGQDIKIPSGEVHIKKFK